MTGISAPIWYQKSGLAHGLVFLKHAEHVHFKRHHTIVAGNMGHPCNVGFTNLILSFINVFTNQSNTIQTMIDFHLEFSGPILISVTIEGCTKAKTTENTTTKC